MQVVIAALVISLAYFLTAFRAELPTLPRVVLYGAMGSNPTARKSWAPCSASSASCSPRTGPTSIFVK